MPHDDAFDSTLALMADPYCFISKRCERLRSDVFEARILLRRTVCMSGPRAAELFYDQRRFTRRGAAPEPLRATLFGKGGVQTLDGEAHQRRKAMFMSVVTPERVALLANEVAEGWRQAASDWHRGQRRVVLYEAAQRLLTRAVCTWAGVPLRGDEVRLRARQLSALFDEAASLHHLRARAARGQAEQWLAGLVEDVRAGRHQPLANSALEVIASHRSLDGALLPPRVAAVELLNVLRPTVAVSVFIVFAAHALHEYPQSLALLQRGNPRDVEHFVQEVRRFYPFFPAVVARSREEFEWDGYSFRQGQRVLLDLYGTNHDARSWEAPHEFRPERFRGHAPGPFELVPQGGGEVQHDHRCPGEGIALALMRVSVDFLARRLGYEVPPQDLRVDFTRLPALPRSHFVMRDVTPLPHNAWANFAFTPS
ncbi:cytochrome P450 [Ideonella sp. BN130291]|uniref:cytochrome P450 n=1 Tax=Ideonella sp. BN130291 TaxID=3112940 RepID=UPI002E25AC60|nr:cytochrome P450 [Ideonella sp. BN130291]